MDKKTAGSRRLIISKNLIMMLVLLVVILIAVFAWYANADTVTAQQSSISASAADGVELALPDKTTGAFPTSNDAWKPNLKFSESGYLKNLVKDITSDGQQFVMPNFEAAKGLKEGRKVITDDVWVEGLSSKESLINTKPNDDDQYNYISFDFYIRSKSENINVTGDSFLAAGSERVVDEEGNVDTSASKFLKGTDIYRKSTYGAAAGEAKAFSADAIVGAMRVSLTGQPVASVSNGAETLDGNPKLKFLWLPRPDVYLNTDNNQNNWTLTTGVKTTDNLAAQTYVHSFYNGNTLVTENGVQRTVVGLTDKTGVKKGLTAGAYSDADVKTVSGTTDPAYFAVSKATDESKLGAKGYYPTLNQSKQIASGAPESSKGITFTAGTEKPNDNRATDGYYVYKMTMNIWIEGEDAEARRSMNNGVFSLKLDFGT